MLRDGVIAEKAAPTCRPASCFSGTRSSPRSNTSAPPGSTPAEAVTDYVRDAAFTTLNRFVALKMLEARELVQECITKGEQSAGYSEFCGWRLDSSLLPDAAAIASTSRACSTSSTEMRSCSIGAIPRLSLAEAADAIRALLAILNAPDLARDLGRGRDDRLGLPVLQQRRRAQEDARREPGAAQQPRTGRAQPVLHAALCRAVPRRQHARPPMVGDAWRARRSLLELCEYLVRSADEPVQPRPKKDPRDSHSRPRLRLGHFLLYSFDLLLAIYEEAWSDRGTRSRSEATAALCARTTRTSTTCAERCLR